MISSCQLSFSTLHMFLLTEQAQSVLFIYISGEENRIV